ERLRETFGLTSVTLLEVPPGTPLTPDRQRDPASWRIVTTVGGKPCTTPDEADTELPVGDELSLVLRGRTLPAADRPGPGGLRRPGLGRAPPAAARRGGRAGQAAGAGGPYPYGPAQRRQPRPAHPARLRQGCRREPSERRDRMDARRARRAGRHRGGVA